MDYPWLWMFLPFGAMIIAAVLLIVLFLPKFYLFWIRASANETLDYLAYKLRLDQYRVERTQNLLKVRIGKVSAVKIHVRGTKEGCEIYYQADATPSGWGTIFLLIMIVYFSVIAIPVILYIFFSERQMVKTKVASLLPKYEKLPQIAEKDETGVMLLNSLGEGYRLSADAYEAQRTSYRDSQAVIAFGAFVFWVLLFLWLLPDPNVQDFGFRALIAFILSLIIAIAIATLPLLLLRRKFHQRILDFKGWANRLRNAVKFESTSRIPPSTTSTFELLVEASKEVPVWLDVLRRSGFTKDPGSYMIIFIWAFWSFYIIMMAITLVLFEGILGLFLVFIGVALTVGLYLYNKNVKRKREEATMRTLSEWNLQFEELRSRMEQYLRDL